MTISAGITAYAHYNGEIMFFVGHPGGNRNDYWSMLKGQHDKGEELIDTTLREFKEESTIGLSKYKDKLVCLGEAQRSKYKTVHAFASELEHTSSIDPKKCKSNVADNCHWPEIDKCRRMSYSDVMSKTHKTHIDFL